MTSLAAPSASTSSVDTSALKRPTQQFGQEQFLTMMLAQLKNQDPLKPLEPSEFLGQLAQFSTVTGVQEMQKSLGTMVDSLRSSQALEGANFVGRQVLHQKRDTRITWTGRLGHWRHSSNTLRKCAASNITHKRQSECRAQQ
jgi:flagellar hook assembly protein FlgD